MTVSSFLLRYIRGLPRIIRSGASTVVKRAPPTIVPISVNSIILTIAQLKNQIHPWFLSFRLPTSNLLALPSKWIPNLPAFFMFHCYPHNQSVFFLTRHPTLFLLSPYFPYINQNNYIKHTSGNVISLFLTLQRVLYAPQTLSGPLKPRSLLTSLASSIITPHNDLLLVLVKLRVLVLPVHSAPKVLPPNLSIDGSFLYSLGLSLNFASLWWGLSRCLHNNIAPIILHRISLSCLAVRNYLIW